jgi:hypothetical protein
MELPRKTHTTVPVLKLLICLLATLVLTNCGNKPGDSSGQKSMSLTGDWSVRYKFEGQMLNASMHLEQKGHELLGSGKDDPSGLPFTIEQGMVRGHQLTFSKKYGGDMAKLPAIQYAGTISPLAPDGSPGPYLSGDFSATTSEGKGVSNDWDAVKDMPAPPAPPPAKAPPAMQVPKQAPAPPPPPPPVSHAPTHDPNKAPDLSGKWEVGFEYQFRTVNSIMFLEQDYEGVRGHGMDDNHDRFIIEKAYYAFPKITIIRKYPKTAMAPAAAPKGKGKDRDKGKPPAEPTMKTMVFKGDVSWVEDADYQGPYMTGKTDGGGKWEAQIVK